MPLKILRTYDNGATQDETRKLPATPLKEYNDAIKRDGIESYRSARAVWTSTNIEYKAGATEGLVWLEGQKKKAKIHLPLNDGWYLPDKKWGIPNGAPSDENNPDALFFSRYLDRNFSGLLVRRLVGFGDGGRRGVDAGYGPGVRLGVIESARKKENHTHKFVRKLVCDCGAVKGEK